MARQKIRIAYDAARNAYAINGDVAYSNLTAAQMMRKMRHYPSDTIVDFESVPKSMQNQVLRELRH